MCPILKNKSSYAAVTISELLIAVVIIVVIFVAIVPQIRSVQNSWASKRETAEMIQNGRALMDHIIFNLKQTREISAVSAPDVTNGYIEFLDNDGNAIRYEIGTGNYVQFGPVGNLADLAGPVSRLQFTCYDAFDLDTAITDVNLIRCVQVQATLTNASPLGADRTFTTWTYLRTNPALYNDFDMVIEGSHCEFDLGEGRTPALAKIDDSHYLCAYTGVDDDGFAVVLTIDAAEGTVTKETDFEFDTATGLTPALVKIDNSHYLCIYTGPGDDGWAVVLTVSLANWTITKETPFEFDTVSGFDPVLAKIDNTHYLCAYQGSAGVGWAAVLTVNNTTWSITKQTPFAYDATSGGVPDLAQIDSTHYLCAYKGSGGAGTAVVLTVNLTTWAITKPASPHIFGAAGGNWPALARMDAANYICAYTVSGNAGWARLLTVNLSTWAITTGGAAFLFAPDQGKRPALGPVDTENCLCAWDGVGDEGTAVILIVDANTAAVTKGTQDYIFDRKGMAPALCHVRDVVYLGVYQGMGDDGWAILFNTGPPVRP